jgi:hypothetical protein
LAAAAGNHAAASLKAAAVTAQHLHACSSSNGCVLFYSRSLNAPLSDVAVQANGFNPPLCCHQTPIQFTTHPWHR